MTQEALPKEDTFIGSWTDGFGGTVGLWSSLNNTEGVDFIRSEDNPANSAVVFKLEPLVAPPDPAGTYQIEIKNRKNTAGAQIDLTVELRQDYVNESDQGELIDQQTIIDLPTTDQTTTLTIADPSTLGAWLDSLFIRLVANTV